MNGIYKYCLNRSISSIVNKVNLVHILNKNNNTNTNTNSFNSNTSYYLHKNFNTYNNNSSNSNNSSNYSRINTNTNPSSNTTNIYQPSYSFRNKMNQFFKKVHPDIIGTITSNNTNNTKNNDNILNLEKIKLENQRSMQEINNFIESLKTGTNFEEKSVSFNIKDPYYENITDTTDTYTAVDTEDLFLKYSFDLPSLFSNSMNSAQRLSIMNRIDEILSEIKERSTGDTGDRSIRNTSTKDKKIITLEEIEANETSQNPLNPSNPLLEDAKPFKIFNSSKFKQDIDNMEYMLKLQKKKDKEYSKHNFMNLNSINNLSKEYKHKYADLISIGTKMTNKIMDLHDISKEFYPYNLIKIDQEINDDKFKEFIEILKKNRAENGNKYRNSNSNKNNNSYFTAIMDKISSQKIIVNINSSSSYNPYHLPGHISIPYNFNYQDLMVFVLENHVKVIQLKNSYIESQKSILKIKQKIKDEFGIKEVELEMAVNSKDIEIDKNTRKKPINKSIKSRIEKNSEKKNDDGNSSTYSYNSSNAKALVDYSYKNNMTMKRVYKILSNLNTLTTFSNSSKEIIYNFTSIGLIIKPEQEINIATTTNTTAIPTSKTKTKILLIKNNTHINSIVEIYYDFKEEDLIGILNNL